MAKVTEESFLAEVSQHEMEIRLDDAIYRSIRFGRPGDSNMCFTLTTWGGHLAYSGDMGCFVFCRTPDMFEFFRPRTSRDTLRINEGYWSEKLVATDRSDGHREISRELFEEHLEDEIQTFLTDNAEEIAEIDKLLPPDKTVEKELRESIQSDILYDFEEFGDVNRSIGDCCGFEFSTKSLFGNFEPYGLDHLRFQMTDFHEHTCTTYTLRFLWACYAILWGIQKYDAHKQAMAPAAV